MVKGNDYLLLISTCPNIEVATQLAHYLLQNRLVACVNILPNVHSTYEWQNEIVNSMEVLLLIKTCREHYATVEQVWVDKHPYDVPELIAVPIETGLPSYLAWIGKTVRQT